MNTGISAVKVTINRLDFLFYEGKNIGGTKWAKSVDKERSANFAL